VRVLVDGRSGLKRRQSSEENGTAFWYPRFYHRSFLYHRLLEL
jgi:hypothetical protein